MSTRHLTTLRLAIVCGLGVAATVAGCGSSRETYRPTARPPATRVNTVTETLHGAVVTDDYRWLEGAGGPSGGPLPPDVATWTDGQNAYTRTVLDAVPGRADVERRLAALISVGAVTLPLVSSNRYFYWHREANELSPTVYARDGALGSDRPLIRPRDLDPSGRSRAEWIMPSPDGRWLAYGVARAGEADSVLRLLDVDADRARPLEIHGSPQAVDWLPDSTGFIYQRLAIPADPSTVAVLFHELGQDPSRDRLLHRQYTAAENPALATTAGPFASLSSDGRWLVSGYWTSDDSNDLWLTNFEELRHTGRSTPRAVSIGSRGRALGSVVGDTLFIQTTKGAPHGRVVAVPIANPGPSGWREIVPERADATIESVTFGRGVVAVTYLKQASNTTEVFDLSGRSLGTLAQPGIGTTALAAREDRTDAFLSFESFNHPLAIYRVDLQTPTRPGALWKSPAVPVDLESVVVTEVQYRSKDGTNVSMFLAHRRDLSPNGALPTIIVGYGAFGARMTPFFTATWFQWFEAGGVLAVPHVRGGGEYGPAWHAAGARDHKMASIDDVIGAAEWLTANRYTSPEKLAIYGAGAGGLLAGGAMTARPDLFRAAVLLTPLLDMLRYDRAPEARAWVPEFGAPADANAFAWLRAYSPYQHVTGGTRYPAVLLAGRDAGAPVDALHARKMAARLQSVTGADPAARPVLLWIEKSPDTESAQALEALVDQRVFLMWQLGMR